MKRFYITVCIPCSNEEVDPYKLHHHNLETARPNTSLYNWYHMSQAVHKMLAQSHQVIGINIISVGYLSEKPQESFNKVFKHNREHHTRKFSRSQTNYDLMMFCSSDPKVSRMRRSQGKEKDSILPEEAKEL